MMGLSIILKSPENVLDFTKVLVPLVKGHVVSAGIAAAVLEYVEKKIEVLRN